jgi:hypothetical protein
MHEMRDFTLQQFYLLLSDLLDKINRAWLNAFLFVKLLKKEGPWPKWIVWTYATVGMKKSLTEMVNLIKERGLEIKYSDSIHLDLYAIEGWLKYNSTKEIFPFVIVTPKELGLNPGYSKREFYRVAAMRNLALCLSGDILEILAFGEFDLKENSGYYWVAMEPILINDQQVIFSLGTYKKPFYLGFLNGNMVQKFNSNDSVNIKHIFRICR